MEYILDIQFFGRGTSKAGGGGVAGKGGKKAGAGYDASEVKLLDGSTLDLSAYPLHYGEKDPTLTDRQRATTEAWEAKRVKAKVEYGTFVDENGRPRMEKRGGKSSVSLPLTGFMYEGNVLTHIHPRDAGSGYLGGTFSFADLKNFALYPARTTRAAAAEGTYSISKTASFDKSGALAFFSRVTSQREAEHDTVCRGLRKQLRSGSISISEFSARSADSFNRMLVNLHNDYASGASQYGYVYTLERRG